MCEYLMAAMSLDYWCLQVMFAVTLFGTIRDINNCLTGWSHYLEKCIYARISQKHLSTNNCTIVIFITSWMSVYVILYSDAVSELTDVSISAHRGMPDCDWGWYRALWPSRIKSSNSKQVTKAMENNKEANFMQNKSIQGGITLLFRIYIPYKK